MPDWILFVALGWFFLAMRARRRAYIGAHGGPRHLHAGWREYHRERMRGAVAPPAQLPVTPAPPPTKDQLEAALRARYVSGKITVEQYESGLDELYRRA
jgi:hypothetical protein